MSNLWRPWETAEDEVRPQASTIQVKKNKVDYNFFLITYNQRSKILFTLHSGAQRKRVSIGKLEKRVIVECYNFCHGKDWKDVLLFAKSRICIFFLIEAGLPDHIVHMYLEQSAKRLTGRMRNTI